MKTRLAVSACLLGERVRYDGESKRDAFVCNELSAEFELIPICPEVGIGMSVPREPVNLHSSLDAPSMIGTESQTDYTEGMLEFARKQAQQLAELDVRGYVFKARSPSCGIRDVPIRTNDGEQSGKGLYVLELLKVIPDFPVIDEDGLQDAEERDAFFKAVRS